MSGDGQVVVRFVKLSIDKPTSNVLEEAFEAIQEIAAETLWFSENECLNVKEKERKFIYVFEDFKGPAFEHILATGNRIYGPVCILHCLKKNISLPKEPYPIFSVSMQGVVVSCTSVLKTSREWVHNYVKWMYGEVSKDFHQNVTHLVAGEVGSKKYLVAAKLKKKIMSPEWVEQVWEVAKSTFVKADDQCFDKYRCPLFKGFVVTVSGLESNERGRIKDVVTKEGGRYSGEMKINECTHLVVNIPRGQKYEFAKQWKIHIVNPKWLFESLDVGYCLEEQDYPVGEDQTRDNDRRGHGTSTPTRRSSTRLSEIPDVSVISISHVNETNVTMMSNSSMVSMRNQTVVGGNQTVVCGNETMTGGNQTVVGGNQSIVGGDNIVPEPKTAEEALASIDISKPKADMFLDGCKIFLSGFKGAQLEKLKKIINIGAGTRFNQINKSVSHVVMGERVESHVTQLREATFRPHVVSVEWIVACYNAGEPISEEAYDCLDLPPLEPTTPKAKSKNLKRNKSVSGPVDDVSMAAPIERPIQANAEPEGMDDILSQYLPGNQSKDTFTMGESTLMRAAEMGEQAANQDALQHEPANQSLANRHHLTNQSFSKADHQPNESLTNKSNLANGRRVDQELPPPDEDGDVTFDPEATVDEGPPSLFQGRQFVILGFDALNEQEIGELLKLYQGKVLPQNTRKVPDYAVVPVFGCPVAMTVGDIVTNAWVQMSIEQEQMLPLESDPTFQPISIVADSTPLEGCVLSVSGYAGTERDAIVHMSTVLGAKVQEFFLKRANQAKKLAASSHLVVNAAEGSKYNACKKWKLPAVTKHWIVECARQNKHVDEELYLVDRPMEHKENNDDNNSSIRGQRLHASRADDNNLQDLQTSEATSNEKVTNVPTDHRVLTSNTPKIDTEVLTVPKNPVNNLDEDMETDGPGSRPRSSVCRESQKENRLKSRCLESPVIQSVDKNDLRLAATPAPGGVPRLAATPAPGGVPRLAQTPVWKTKPQKVAPTMESTPKPFNSRVRELTEEGRETPQPHQSLDTSRLTTDSPNVFLNPDKSFHAKFDLSEAFADLQSPATPRSPGGTKRKGRPSLTLEEVFTYNLNIAVENQKLKKGSGLVADGTPYSQRRRAAIEEETQEPRGPLYGVIIAVSKKLSTQQSEYNNIASSLGADYRWTYDRSCTHFIFQGRQNDTNKEFRLAKDQGKIIVSPHWLSMCQDQNCRVDEMLFPHTFNPNLSLAVTPARSTRRSTRTKRGSSKSTSKTPETAAPIKSKAMFDSLDTTQSDEEIAQVVENMEVEEKESHTQALANDLKTLMAATRTYSKTRRTARRTDSFTKLTSNDGNGSTLAKKPRNSSTEGMTSPRSSRGERLPTRSRNSRSKPETQTEASQMIEVSWDDPAAREQQQRLALDLAKNSESFNEHPTDSSIEEEPAVDDEHVVDHTNKNLERLSVESDQRVPTPEAPSLAFPLPMAHDPVSPPRPVEIIEEMTAKPANTRPLILMSGMGQNERDDYGALVEQLGGVIIDSGQYDHSCTHLVVGNPARNEKYLSSVAAGKWVLHKSYFEACRQASRFVEEEPHEWGSDHTSHILKGLSAQVAKLAQAAHRWRHWLHQQQRSSQGAFDGWCVMLLTDKKKEDGFRRLLEAGGGTIVTTKYPYVELEDITHAFIDLNKIKFQVDFEELVRAEIHCLKPEYIAAYLMDDPQPEPTAHYLPDVLKLLKISNDARKRKASGTVQPSTPSSKRYRR